MILFFFLLVGLVTCGFALGYCVAWVRHWEIVGMLNKRTKEMIAAWNPEEPETMANRDVVHGRLDAVHEILDHKV